MTQASGTMVLVAGLATTAAGGPLSQVLNELTLVMALSGLVGGVVLGLSVRGTHWKDFIRGAVLGFLLAPSIGAIGPPLLSKLIGVEIAASADPSMVAGVSFLIGFFQERIFALRKAAP